MQCSDTDHALPAIRIPKEDIDLALRLNAMRKKIKDIGGEGDTEVSLRMQPNGKVQSVKYTFVDRDTNKKSA